MFQHSSQRQEGAVSVLSHQDPLIACPTLASTKQNKCAEKQNNLSKQNPTKILLLVKGTQGLCYRRLPFK